MARDVFDSETRRQIGARLRALRGDATQKDFATKLGVSRVALSNYEAGRRLPAQSILSRYAGLGSASVSWMLTGVVEYQAMAAQIEPIRRYIAECFKAGLLPKSLVSDDEMALVKVMRAIKMGDSTKLVERLLQLYDKYPEHKYGYANRFAERLRRLVANRIPLEAGIDLEALIEGFDLLRPEGR